MESLLIPDTIGMAGRVGKKFFRFKIVNRTQNFLDLGFHGLGGYSRSLLGVKHAT